MCAPVTLEKPRRYLVQEVVASRGVLEAVAGVVEALGELRQVEVERPCQLPDAGLRLGRGRRRLLQQGPALLQVPLWG